MGSVIRIVAILTSGIVLLGFSLFAVDEMDRGSKNQQEALARELDGADDVDPAAIAPSAEEEHAREAQHGTVREGVDDANDVLLAPFANLIDSGNAWVSHGVPTVLALLLYGLGLGFVANLLPKQRAHGADWRTAES
jgi:hypothetical protein